MATFILDSYDRSQQNEILPEDDSFAVKILNYYKSNKALLNLEDLKKIVKYIRYLINQSEEAETAEADRTEEYNLLFNSTVQEINITTDKGEFKLYPLDYLFHCLENAIKNSKHTYKTMTDKEHEFYEKSHRGGIFSEIHEYFNDIPGLGKKQRYVYIGLFCVHFRIYSNRPLKSKTELGSTTSAYNQYLAERVKRLVESFSESSHKGLMNIWVHRTNR